MAGSQTPPQNPKLVDLLKLDLPVDEFKELVKSLLTEEDIKMFCEGREPDADRAADVVSGTLLQLVANEPSGDGLFDKRDTSDLLGLHLMAFHNVSGNLRGHAPDPTADYTSNVGDRIFDIALGNGLIELDEAAEAENRSYNRVHQREMVPQNDDFPPPLPNRCYFIKPETWVILQSIYQQTADYSIAQEVKQIPLSRLY